MVDSELFVHTETEDSTTAAVRVDAGDRADHDVEPMLYAKFCEHLGNNIYHGMEAEILFNPTFGEWHFRGSDDRPSGGYVSENDRDRIESQVRDHHRPLAYPPETDPDALLDAYDGGMAFGWQPFGDVNCSPDTGPNGNRAQRLDVEEEGGGTVQETRLPLHRVHEYEFRTRIRAPGSGTVRASVRSGETVYDEVSLDVSGEWEILEGSLEVPTEVDTDAVYEVALTADGATDFVVERFLLYPGDHLDYADPDVVERLRESDLPLLRWPGGNFVSGYHWRDGVGLVDDRPTRINPAWGGLEPNLFGTAEFVTFCDHVGCEPSICVNAGDGTPEEAAAWVEYCNGDPETTEMGRLRAEHGYPEPFDITYWEIGNELWGEWQVHWTTPRGNADRYERFREAMLEADPDVEVTACGVVANEDRPWNDVLLEECGETVRAISSHPLAGGRVDAETDPDELYHAFMGYPEQLTDQYADLEDRMREAGVSDPKLDVTELQLFASFVGGAEGAGREADDAPDAPNGGLTPETMPTPQTISEALYDACMRHELIRLGEFAEMLTHSATVNHGGGLQKDGERVWCDPCHYGRSIGTAQAGATPVPVELECGSIATETTFREIEPVHVPALDAMATLDDEFLRVVLVNRASHPDPVRVTLSVDGVSLPDTATVTSLGGEAMYDENTREDPFRVTPDVETIHCEGNVAVDLSPYSMARVDFERT